MGRCAWVLKSEAFSDQRAGRSPKLRPAAARGMAVVQGAGSAPRVMMSTRCTGAFPGSQLDPKAAHGADKVTVAMGTRLVEAFACLSCVSSFQP